MLASILIWFYVCFLALIYGFSLINLVSEIFKTASSERPPVSVLIMVGLGLLTSVAGILSLVLKMGLLANLLVLALAFLQGWRQRKSFTGYLRGWITEVRGLHWLTLLAFVTIFLVVLLKSIQAAQNYDTGLYHAQAIRWMETYPAIPGLGNLADRLAFNSSWLLLSALFSFSFLGLPSFHGLNALLALVMTGYALSRFDRLLKGDVSFGNLAAVFLPFLLRRIFSLELSSPGTDLPAALLIWVIVIQSIEKIDRQAVSTPDYRFLAITVLSVFSVMVKLSTLPILILPLYFYLRLTKRVAAAAPLAILASFLLFPWLARSVIQSGYLVYPVPETRILQPDWQIPEETARDSARWVRSWAKIATPEREAVEQMSLSEWVPVWYQNLVPLDRQILLLNGAALVLLLVLLVYQVWKHGLRIVLGSPYLIPFLVVFVGIIYWFFQAPAMRFGYAFLAVLPVLCAVPYALRIMRLSPFLCRWGALSILAALLLYQGVSLARLGDPDALRAAVIYPVDYPRAATNARALNSMTVHSPVEGDQCWYDPFPCVPRLEPGVEMRGETVLEGFRTAP